MEQSPQANNMEEVYENLQALALENNWKGLNPDILEEAVQVAMLRIIQKGDVVATDKGLIYVILRGEISNLLHKRKLWNKVGIPFSDVDASIQEPMADDGDDDMNRSIKAETKQSIVASMIAATASSPVPGSTSKEILMRLLLGGDKVEATREEMEQYGEQPPNAERLRRADARIRQRISRFIRMCRSHIEESGAETIPLLSLRALGPVECEMNGVELVQAVINAGEQLREIENTDLKETPSADAKARPMDPLHQKNSLLITVPKKQEKPETNKEVVKLIKAVQKNLTQLLKLVE